MKAYFVFPPLLATGLFVMGALMVVAPIHAADPVAPSADAPKINYVYNAKVVRVIDGATVALDVDLGFHVWVHNQIFVLQGVTAPPPDAPDKAAAMQAKTRVQELLHADDEVVLQSIHDKNDKSGAYHAVIWKDGVNLNGKLGTL